MADTQSNNINTEQEEKPGRAEAARNPKGFLDELRERKVYQTTVIYVAAAWAVIQFADIVAPRLGMPDWSITLMLWVLIAALPVVIVLSWVFEIKSHGWSSFPTSVTRFFSSVRYVVLWIVAFGLVVMLATLFFGGAPRKSFALAPKDSVLVGQFQNFTANQLLDNSLELALRVAFEQSRHAYVIPQARIQQTMAQMMLGRDAEIDRELAIQVALREAAKALIIGSIGEVGSTYTLSVEVVDPSDGRTVLLETATVNDANEILVTLDTLTRDVRSQLGESVEDVADTTLELDRVTTANLEALRAYSLGIRAAGRGEIQDAIDLFQRAIVLDPEFSMAHAKLATLYDSALEEPETAAMHRELALQYIGRLTERERVYVEASQTKNGKPADMIRAWRMMRVLFPEEAVGHHNLATVYWQRENDFVEAARGYADAVAIMNPWQHLSQHYLGFVQLGLGNFDAALESFQSALEAGSFPIDGGLADAYIARGDYEAARRFLVQARDVPSQQLQFELDQRWIDLGIDEGSLDEAMELADVALGRARDLKSLGFEYRARAARLAILERTTRTAEFIVELERLVEPHLALLDEDEAMLGFSPIDHLLVLGKIAARNGRRDLAQQILDSVASRASDSGFYFRDTYFDILSGEIALAQGRVDEAIQLLLDAATDRPFFQLHESLARAYERAGDLPAAAAEYEWLIQNRGLALAEAMDKLFQREFSMLDSIVAHFHLGQLHEKVGDLESAKRSYESFLDRWSSADADLPMVMMATERIATLDR